MRPLVGGPGQRHQRMGGERARGELHVRSGCGVQVPQQARTRSHMQGASGKVDEKKFNDSL